MLAAPDMPSARAVSCASLLAYILRIDAIGERLLKTRLFLNVVVSGVFLFAGLWILAQVDAIPTDVNHPYFFEVFEMLAYGCDVRIRILRNVPVINFDPAACVGVWRVSSRSSARRV